MDTINAVTTRRSLPIALLRTRELVMQHVRPHLAELGVTEQQWRVLRVLGEDGASEAGQVATRACILPPSLSRIIKTLQQSRLIRSTPDKSDGRRSILALTDKGTRLLATAAPHSGAVYQQIERRIGKARLNQLLDLLDDVQQALAAPS
jgi:homoprotocatechuate degradation regulator HpaR